MKELTPAHEFHPQLNSDKMRVSQVSAFQTILENGLLSRMRFLVYQEIHEAYLQGQTLTSGEIDRILSGKLDTWTRAASPRLNELVRLKVIRELGEKRVCTATGMRVLQYTVEVGALPEKEEVLREKPTPRANPDEVLAFLNILSKQPLTQEELEVCEPVISELLDRAYR